MKMFLTLVLIINLPHFAFASCAGQEEYQAFDLRALQSSMMVAALSCDQHKQYNKFISKYKDDFSQGSEEITSYFKKHHGSVYKEKLNSFITSLANKALKQSMKNDSDVYCEQMKAMFSDLLTIDENMLVAFVEDRHLDSLHGVNSCS